MRTFRGYAGVLKPERSTHLLKRGAQACDAKALSEELAAAVDACKTTVANTLRPAGVQLRTV